MRCPICQTRPAKRQCPARGDMICAVCCGTKRLVEIRCPSDCGYLASRPPASAGRRPATARARCGPAAAGDERAHRTAVALLLSVPVDCRAASSRSAATRWSTRMWRTRRRVWLERSRPLRAASSTSRRPRALNAQELANAFKQAFAELTAQMEGPRSPLERDAAKALARDRGSREESREDRWRRAARVSGTCAAVAEADPGQRGSR